MFSTFRALIRYTNYIKIPTNALGSMDIILHKTIKPSASVGLVIYKVNTKTLLDFK
jgi:hypothetical protein